MTRRDDTVTPDEKDWTWTVERRCPECGFDAANCDPTTVAALLKNHADAWPDRLAADDAGQRPQPQTWSPLEYACHVRDCCAVFAKRLDLLLTEDDPLFADWNQDTTAVGSRYRAADPTCVGIDLVAQANLMAEALAAVPSGAWQRPGRRSNGASFTTTTLVQYFAHDVVHHGWDVGLQVDTPA